MPVEAPADETFVVNEILRQNSNNTGFRQYFLYIILILFTAAIFFPLPPPPSRKANFEDYARKVKSLSTGLPPIYMVRANENVMTTEI